MKKKLLVLVIVVALVASLTVGLVACNKGDTDKTNAGAIAVENLKIGVLHIGNKDDDSGYTYAHQKGILAMKSSLGLSDSQMVYKDNLSDEDSAAITRALDELVAAKCNVIIGTSFGYGDEMDDFAKKYPKIYFSHATGGYSNDVNFNNYFGRIYQARYLSGIVAGLKADVGANVGYVVAHSTYIAECTSGVSAFALGVQSVNPTAKVYTKALGSWYDPTNEAAYAATLLSEYNCQVITQHCDTSNPSNEAKQAGKYSIGYNSDMAKAIGTGGASDPSVLTSVVWNWGVYYTQLIENIVAGTFTDFGNYYGDISEDLFGLADLSTACADGTADVVALAKAIMADKNDSWDVFSGVKLSFAKNAEDVWAVTRTDSALKDNAGNVIVAAGGASVSDFVICAEMPYWVEGVIELK